MYPRFLEAPRVALLIIWDVQPLPDGDESANAIAVEIFDREQLDQLVSGARERGLRFEVHP